MRAIAVVLVATAGIGFGAMTPDPPSVSAPDRARGVAAFGAITPALRHPRCLVCHSSRDYPRQGDDLHPHIMDVHRGPHGEGAAPVRCSTCHQDHNLAGVHMPPGAPGWNLPSPQNPMIWEGLTDSQLCWLLTDPRRNGGRDAKAIELHMHTPLVLWGWHPGEGRKPESMPESTFLSEVHVWTTAGAPCPDR
jgi:hypothetical protein